jgi:hypothetical protein
MRVKHHQQRRLTGRVSVLAAALGLLVFFGSAQAASAAPPGARNVTPGSPSFGNPEGCPGDIVELTTAVPVHRFSPGSQTNAVHWNDPGIDQQFGPPGGALFDTVNTHDDAHFVVGAAREVTQAVIPLFFQLWEGPEGTHLASSAGTVTFGSGGGGLTFSFTYKNLYSCFGQQPVSASIMTVYATASGNSVTANCPSGDVALGGGGTNDGNGQGHYTSSGPVNSTTTKPPITNGKPPTGWFYEDSQDIGPGTAVTAYVTCAS